MKKVALFSLLLVTPVFGQQPSPGSQLSASEVANSIIVDVGMLARLAEQQRRTIESLQAQVKALQDKANAKPLSDQATPPPPQ